MNNRRRGWFKSAIAPAPVGPPVLTTFGGISGSSKYAGGVYYNGSIYFIPHNASQVMELDTATLAISFFGSLGTSAGKWDGGVLGPNNKIYGIPANSQSVLEIDPVAKTATTFGSLGTAGGKWSRGVLAQTGLIYGAPYNNSFILEIDPVAQTASTVGSNQGTAFDKHIGGTLGRDGKIYFAPFRQTYVLEFDPVTKTTSSFGTFSSTLKWLGGGTPMPDGLIYCAGLSVSTVLVIDPISKTTTTFSSNFPVNSQCLAPNGLVYATPGGTIARVLEINTTLQNSLDYGSLGAVSVKYAGIILANTSKIYTAPFNSSSLLEISNIGSASPEMYTLPSDLSTLPTSAYNRHSNGN